MIRLKRLEDAARKKYGCAKKDMDEMGLWIVAVGSRRGLVHWSRWDALELEQGR